MAVLARRAAAYGSRAPDPGMYHPGKALPWFSSMWAENMSWARTTQYIFSIGTANLGVFRAANIAPTLVSNADIINGRSYLSMGDLLVDWDSGGVNNILSLPAQTFSVVCLFRITSFTIGGSSSNSIIMPYTGSGYFIGVTASGMWGFNIGGGIVSSTVSADTTSWHMLRLSPASATTSTLFIDEVAVATGNSGALACTGFMLNRTGNSTSSLTGGLCHIAFGGLYHHKVQADNLTTRPDWGSFKNWVRSYYGIKVA